MGHSCGWATGAHMTEFSADGAGTHEAGALGVSGSGGPTEGVYVCTQGIGGGHVQ